MTVASRGISLHLSSNNTPSSSLYRVDIKIKAVLEETYNEELPAGIVDYSNYFPLVIDYGLKMGYITLLWIDFVKRY